MHTYLALQPQQPPTIQPNGKNTLRVGDKNKKLGSSITTILAMATLTNAPTHNIPPCALCDLTSYATNNCLSLPKLQ